MNIKTFLLSISLILASSLSLHADQWVGGRSDFRDETIYFAITTRFYDGDPSNNTYCWDGKLNVNDPEWRGDFKGLIEKLDYIKALGFSTIWITPVVENCSGLDYHGYHAFNFSKVDPRYESEDCKFQDLIDAAHAKGIKVVLDIVLNHTGNFGEDTLCPLFEKDYSQNLSDANASLLLHPNSQLTNDYFTLPGGSQYSARLAQMKNVDGINHDSNNYWHHYGSFNWDDDTRWWGQIAGDCVDLNTENQYVVDYLVSCYGKFIEMGVDGFRIDTGGHISRLTFNNMFIPAFNALGEMHKEKRGGTPFFMFAEICARYRQVTYRNQDRLSAYFYTWKEDKDYQWDNDPHSWDGQFVREGNKGTHVNVSSVDQSANDYKGEGKYKNKSTNALLDGNNYHQPDYSMYSGLSVIDFPMHWNFQNAESAFSVRGDDGMYNDASWNVVYVDSHDYGPDSFSRFDGGATAWAENLDLMYTFRGIPCVLYGSEIEFRAGATIDEGPYLALKESGRAYYGGYIEGEVTASDFGKYSTASGNAAATLSNPLVKHIQRLSQIRMAVPALRKGQYSTQGCNGKVAFKRRYTDEATDSYALVSISGNADFTGIENGTYIDCITGDTKIVTDGKLSVKGCQGKGNMRIYVLSTTLTPAPGKIGDDGKFLYDLTPVTGDILPYDGNQEPEDTETERQTSDGPSIEEPETPIEPSMQEGEQAAFFENSADWGGYIKAWVWSSNANYTGGTWPGQNCQYLGNHIWKWIYDGNSKLPDDTQIIFNNGSSQTADMKFVNGGYYDANGYVKTIEGTGDIPDEPQGEEVVWTLYYDDNNFGSETWAYFWDRGNGNKTYLGSWPGTKLSFDNETGYLKVSFTTTDNIKQPMVVFSCGNSSNQSADWEAVNNGVYNRNGFVTTSLSYTALSDMEIYGEIVYASVISQNSGILSIYSLDGRCINAKIKAGYNKILLHPGFYIVNHKKIVVR